MEELKLPPLLIATSGGINSRGLVYSPQEVYKSVVSLKHSSLCKTFWLRYEVLTRAVCLYHRSFVVSANLEILSSLKKRGQGSRKVFLQLSENLTGIMYKTKQFYERNV
jgi:hypothetical protein